MTVRPSEAEVEDPLVLATYVTPPGGDPDLAYIVYAFAFDGADTFAGVVHSEASVTQLGHLSPTVFGFFALSDLHDWWRDAALRRIQRVVHFIPIRLSELPHQPTPLS